MEFYQIQEALAIAPLVTHSQTAADVSPAMVIQYVPALGTGGTAATVKSNASRLKFLVDAATVAGGDAIGSATGTLIFTTYDSMGELLDAINAGAAWRAYLVGSLRTDDPTKLLAQAATSVIGAHGAAFYWDTSQVNKTSVAISGEKFVNNGPHGHVKDSEDKCINTLLFGREKMTAAGTLNFYSSSQGADAQIGPVIAVALNTAVEQNTNQPALPYLQAKIGERLIIRFAATSSDGTPTEFRFSGKSAVLKSGRIVSEANY